MRNAKVFRFLFAVVLLGSGSLTWAKEIEPPPFPPLCNEETQFNLYFSASPGFRGVVESVNALFSGYPERRKCLENVQNTPSIQASLARGNSFRQAYLAKYETYFVTESERNLVLLPEIEARRSLYAEMESGKRNKSEAPPPEVEIRQRALRETLTRYGLPSSLSESAFERITRSEAKYFAAKTEMQRLEYRLRENWRVPRQVSQRSPDAFKAAMSEKLNRARIENLRASVREGLSEWSGQALEFTDRQTKRRISLRIEDLATSSIQFMAGDTFASGSDQALTQVPKRKGRGLGTWFVSKFQGEIPAVYEGNVVKQNQRDEIVQLTTPHKEVVFISGADYTAILNSLAPKSVSDHFARDPVSHRFRTEASARDAQLSNLIQFMDSRSDRSLEELFGRLSERIKGREFDQSLATPYLTYEINAAGSKILEHSLASDVIWFGWGQLPQFWKFREVTARNLKAPFLPDLVSANKKFAKETKKEIRRTSWRYLTEAERTKKLTKKSSPTLVGALLVGGWLTGILPNPVTLLHEYLPHIPIPFNLAADMDQDSMNQEARANNFNIPAPEQDGKGGGPLKKLSDPHDPASSDYKIEIISRGPQIPLPQYFNTAKLYQLPKDLVRLTYGDHDYDSNLDHLRNSDRPTDSDLTLDGNYKIHEATGRRVALVQMTNFHLQQIQLYDYQNKLIPYDSYSVYEVRTNHATYARIDEKADVHGPYTFRAQYKYDQTGYGAGSLDAGLPKSAVTQVEQRLRSSGFTELSTKLEQALASTKLVSYDFLANEFAQDATYTNHGKTWWTNFLADSQFREFTKFVNDQGQLFYQCTGSNLLFGRFLDEINATAKIDGAHFTPLLGFRNDGEHGSERGSPGHLHTLVTNAEDHGYLELDATPVNEDEPDHVKDGQGQNSGGKKPPTPEPAQPGPTKPTTAVDQPWIRPEKLKIPNDPSERVETAPVEPPPKPAEEKIVIKPVSHDRGEIERILRRVTQMREISVADVRGAVEHNAALKNQHLVDLPGVRLVVLAKVLLRGFEDSQTPERLLHALQDPKGLQHGKPRPIDRDHARAQLNQYFAAELVSYRKSIAQLEMDAREGRNSPFEFLTYDPVRSHLRELVEVLSVYAWGDLLERYHALPKCKDVLSAKPLPH